MCFWCQSHLFGEFLRHQQNNNVCCIPYWAYDNEERTNVIFLFSASIYYQGYHYKYYWHFLSHFIIALTQAQSFNSLLIEIRFCSMTSFVGKNMIFVFLSFVASKHVFVAEIKVRMPTNNFIRSSKHKSGLFILQQFLPNSSYNYHWTLTSLGK